MNKRNLKEYQTIKQEINEIKSCITRYVAILFGESGLSFFLTIYIKEKDVSGNSFPLILFLLFSIGLTLSIFYVLIYKFKSHNRYAGYIKLINQEVQHAYDEEEQRRDPIIAWELVMSKFVNSPDTKEYPYERVGKMSFQGIEETDLRDKWDKLHSSNKKADRKASLKGLTLIINQILPINLKKIFFREMFERPKGWSYPVSIANVVYVFVLFFVGLGTYILTNSKCTFDANESLIMSLFIVPILIMLYRSFGDIHKLVYGSKTIESYCWLFLFPRVEILNKFDYRPIYIQTFSGRMIPDTKNQQTIP